MKEDRPRRPRRSAREAAQQELAGLLPAIQSAAADAVDKPAEMKKSLDKTRVDKAATYTVDRVTKDITELQGVVGRTLDDLAQQMVREAEKLAELRSAIDTETARLKELHEIDVTLISLKAVLEVGADRRASLEADLLELQNSVAVSRKRTQEEWEREQQDYEARTKKNREREEEDFVYKLTLKRRKDNDDYAVQQAGLQKALQELRAKAEVEIGERIKTVSARELETKELQAKVERFPQDLAAAVKQAEQMARVEVQKQADLDAKLAKLEVDGDKRLTALKIAGLEESLKRQMLQNEVLGKQLSAAQAQVQAMAVKAIEGASGKNQPAT